MPMRKDSSLCSECPAPVLYEDNVEAWELFVDCHTQYSYCAYVPVGLRFEAVDFAMKCRNIPHSSDLLDRLKILETHHLKILRDG